MTEVSYEKWVWTELLAFDVTQPDFGVSEYLDTLGFVPTGISLLISSPDIILQHEGLEQDAELSPHFCSRNGHEGNEIRRRQRWTRYQLRQMIANLRSRGCAVYLSNFIRYMEDKFHREWLTDNPECKMVHVTHGRREALFILTRMRDGTYLQDYFAAQLKRVCEDYGFDGWHGPDGYGPASTIYILGFDDDVFGQFLEWGGSDGIPEEILAPTEDLPEKLTRRRDWIWRHRRLQWIEFFTDRWAAFWRTIVDAMHSIGRKTMINSAWTRDPFEAMYRFGIDYRKIAATGVDAIMVETAAGGIMLGSNERDYHYDYLAMLMHIKACVPDTKLIFLHNTKDVVEDWDLIRHSPTMLEREVYSLANVYHQKADGKLVRSVDGFLACLGDGLSRQEWSWLGQQWRLAFTALPKRVLGAKLLWRGSWMDRFHESFPILRDVSAHRLTYGLMEHNAPIQMTVSMEGIAHSEGPFLLLHPHLLTEEEKQTVLQCKQTVIAIGPDFTGWPQAAIRLVDGYSDRPVELRIYGVDDALATSNQDAPIGSIAAQQQEPFPADVMGIEEPIRFRALPYYRPVSEAFYKACARWIQIVSKACSATSQTPPNLQVLPPFKIGIMMTELEPGVYRLGVKNSATIYGRPIIDIGRPIRSVKVRSAFPVTTVHPEESSFKLVVPQCGIVVCDVYTDPDQ